MLYEITSELEFTSEDDKISVQSLLRNYYSGTNNCNGVDPLLQTDQASSAFYGVECVAFNEIVEDTSATTADDDDSTEFQGAYLFLAGAGGIITALCIIAMVCSLVDNSPPLDRDLSMGEIQFMSSERIEDPEEKRTIVKAAKIIVENGGGVMPKEQLVGGASTLTIDDASVFSGSRMPYSPSNAVMRDANSTLTMNQSEEFRDYDDLEMTPMNQETSRTPGDLPWMSLVQDSDNSNRDKEVFESEFAAMCGVIDEDKDAIIQVEEFEKIQSCAAEFFPEFSLDTTGGNVNKEDLKELFKNSDNTGYDLDKLRRFKIRLESFMEEEESEDELISVEPSAEFEAEFKTLCDLVDVDGDKIISLEEFARVYPVATQTFYKMLDTNGDAALSIEEFREMFILADGSGDLEQVREMQASLESEGSSQKVAMDEPGGDNFDDPDNGADNTENFIE